MRLVGRRGPGRADWGRPEDEDTRLVGRRGMDSAGWGRPEDEGMGLVGRRGLGSAGRPGTCWVGQTSCRRRELQWGRGGLMVVTVLLCFISVCS